MPMVDKEQMISQADESVNLTALPVDGCWHPDSVRKIRWFRKIKKRDIILAAVLLIPLWMFLAWLLTPLRPIRFLIVDKTVPNFEYNEHRTVIWLLRHFRISNGERLYRADRDYFGFHPLEQGKSFHADDMDAYDSTAGEAMLNFFDAVWITDTYGVYRDDWLHGEMANERNPLVSGRLQRSEAAFIRNMADRGKLILAEFNFIGTPTSRSVRRSMEDRFRFRWTGWTGRYFDSLDSLETDLPRWVVKNYCEQYDTTWHFHNSGIVLTHSSERIVILENMNQLDLPVPEVFTLRTGSEFEPDLPPSMNYPFWFDINIPDTSLEILAEYRLHLNARGDSLMRVLGIPSRFPAVMRSRDRLFYYFAGDVSDTRINDLTAYFKGIQAFRSFFYRVGDENDRDQFFWEYSYPLVRRIFNDHWEHMQNGHSESSPYPEGT